MTCVKCIFILIPHDHVCVCVCVFVNVNLLIVYKSNGKFESVSHLLLGFYYEHISAINYMETKRDFVIVDPHIKLELLGNITV